jgi:hypothetical protein
MWMPNLLIGHIDVENENQLFVGHFPGETHGNHVFFFMHLCFLPVNDATIETGPNMWLDD